MKISYQELKAYLYENYCFGFIAIIRKNTIIYEYKRFLPSKGFLLLKVKIDKKTKEVISVLHKDIEYTDFNEVKKLISP